MRNQCPTALLMADIHLRSSTPKCRTDDFLETQRKKLDFVNELLDELEDRYDERIPVLGGGDIFHSSNPSPWLISESLRHLPQLITIPGQHDLPAHNLKNLEKSGLWTLYEADRIFLFGYGGETYKYKDIQITGFPYGTRLKRTDLVGHYYKVALIHTMVYKNRKPFPGAKGKVHTIMRKLKGYDLIVSGDNHIPFWYKRGDQLLVNCGSMTRQRASETHKPRVWAWYAKENEVDIIYLPSDKKAISRVHIEKEKSKNKRIEAFTDRLSNEIELSIEFKDNLTEYIAENKISKPVVQKINEGMEE